MSTNSLRPIFTPADAQHVAQLAAQHQSYPGTLIDPDRGGRLRRWWRRITPWPVIAASPLLIIPVGMLVPPPAEAFMVRPLITTTVVWTGPSDCIQIWVPVGGDLAEPRIACSPDHAWLVQYPAPRRGEWIGVDPEMGRADTLSCAVTASTGETLTDFGVAGDGNEVSCLVRW